MQGVKDRIKATFVSLIPDDQWEVMVKKEIDDFFKQREQGYSNRYCSDFRNVVNEVCKEMAEKKVREVLSDPDFNTEWSGNRETVSKAIKSQLISSAPEIFATAIENLVANSIQKMKYQ